MMSMNVKAVDRGMSVDGTHGESEAGTHRQPVVLICVRVSVLRVLLPRTRRELAACTFGLSGFGLMTGYWFGLVRFQTKVEPFSLPPDPPDLIPCRELSEAVEFSRQNPDIPLLQLAAALCACDLAVSAWVEARIKQCRTSDPMKLLLGMRYPLRQVRVACGIFDVTYVVSSHESVLRYIASVHGNH